MLCLAYRIGDGPIRLWTPEDGDCPAALVEHIAAGGLLEAHNVLFEIAVWESVCVARMGWPAVPLTQWRDSMALAAAMAIPLSLAAGASAMGTQSQKDLAGKAAMLKLSVPRRPTKADASEWNNDPALFAQLYAYCRQDVAAEYDLSHALPPLSAHEVEVFQASTAINRRGVACDREAVEGALRIMRLAEADYHTKVAHATAGVLTGEDLGSWQKVLPWLAGRGIHLPNYQKGTLSELDLSTLPPDCRTVIQARLALGRTSTAKYQAMLDRLCADGRIRGSFTYHGANTGRWAGRGIQPQNLPRGTLTPTEVDACFRDMRGLTLEEFRDLWGDPFAAASSCIRGALVAGPGKILVAADYAAIEARVLLWMAGDPGLAIFRDGRDIYKEMAAVIYGTPVEQVTKAQRQVGKIAILALGYGMGWEKFKLTCASYGIDIEDDFAKRVVDTYRSVYERVKLLWYALENAAIGAVRTGSVTLVRDGLIKFKMQGPHLKMRLPSGRLLTYPFAEIHPRMTPWGDSKDALTFMAEDVARKWTRTATYGGSLAENADQAISRDLAADAIVRAERRGFPVVLHSHDELVCEIDDTPISAEAKDLCALMTELPPWAAGLPVAAEGFKSRRYRK